MKSISLNERDGMIRQAFYAQYAPNGSHDAGAPWVMDVYEDHLIATAGSAPLYWRVEYQVEGTSVTFAPRESWQMVEREYVPVAVGSAIKTLGEGKLGGHLVVFGDAGSTDLEGDYFTKSTDFGVAEQVGVYYLHGLDGAIKKRRIGVAKVGVDDVGVWVEAQLDLRDAYEKAVYDLAAKGKLGWSSGSAPHLVEREREGKSARIVRWPLVEASLTPVPAEPRAHAVAMKTLSELVLELPEAQPEGSDDPAGAADEASPSTFTQQEDKAMDNEQNPAEGQELVELVTQLGDEVKSLKALVENAPASNTMGGAKPAGDTPEVKAWREFIRYGDGAAYRGAIKAAMQRDTDGEGGYLVPIQYANEVVAGLRDASILRAAGARVLTVSGAKTFRVPGLSYSSAAVLTAEEAAYNQAEPTVTEVVFTPFKYTKLSKVSEELLADSMVDVSGQILTPDAIIQFAAAENAAFTTGTGSSQPQGVVTGSSLGKTAAGVAAVTADEIIDLYHSLSYLYRQNAVWMMNDATAQAVRKLKDTTNQYLWQPGLAAGQPDRLLGRPVITNNSMATLATGNKTILFGDFRYYWIVDFGPMSMMRLNELYAANGQIGFRWYKRFDGRVMLSEAIKHLIQA